VFSRDPLHLHLGAAENREPELLEEPEIRCQEGSSAQEDS